MKHSDICDSEICHAKDIPTQKASMHANGNAMDNHRASMYASGNIHASATRIGVCCMCDMYHAKAGVWDMGESTDNPDGDHPTNIVPGAYQPSKYAKNHWSNQGAQTAGVGRNGSAVRSL